MANNAKQFREVRRGDVVLVQEPEVLNLLINGVAVKAVATGEVTLIDEDQNEATFFVVYNAALNRFMAVVPDRMVAVFDAVFGW